MITDGTYTVAHVKRKTTNKLAEIRQSRTFGGFGGDKCVTWNLSLNKIKLVHIGCGSKMNKQ